ncbi:MAG: gamma carbonic anhydrase family protein [Nitrospiraceae bacterium]
MLIEFERKMPRVNPTAYIAPGAILVGDVTVLAGASVWFNAVIRADFNSVIIGEGSNVQDNAVVHCGDTATVLGKNVTVGHGAIIEGCRIGDGTVIGMNAVVLPGVEIGEGSMIAAGAVVPEGAVVPPAHLAAGVPAKVVKELEGSSRAWVARAATDYRQLSQAFLRQNLRDLKPPLMANSGEEW